MEPGPKELGEQTEAIVLAELVQYDLSELAPFGENNRYDFVLESDNEFHRVQVKTGRYRDGKVIFSTKSNQLNTSGSTRSGYSSEIDYFIVYCWELESFYVISITEAADGEMTLRVESPKNNQTKGINWAEDYRLNAQIEQLLGT